MKFNNIKKSNLIIYTIFFIILAYSLFVFFYMIPKDIHHEFIGIRFQAGNTNLIEPVLIKVEGTYKRKSFMSNDFNKFEGTIMIDGEKSYSDIWDHTKFNVFKFNNNKMASIVNNNFEGHLFIDNMMKEITILIYHEDKTGFDFKSGWLISGPASTREQAVTITNDLISETYGRSIE